MLRVKIVYARFAAAKIYDIKIYDIKIIVLAMRKADERQLRHFADRGAAPAHARTPS